LAYKVKLRKNEKESFAGAGKKAKPAPTDPGDLLRGYDPGTVS
jgi:hypothetical protein